MSETNEKNNTAAALDFARRTTEPKSIVVTFEGAHEEVLLTSGSDGETRIMTARDLFADRAAAPQRRKGTIVVHDLASFIGATNRDSDDGSVIFADVGAKKLTAVLDFHEPGGGDPRWGQNRIEYGFRPSPQLSTWLDANVNKDGTPKAMDQKTFSRLIDDRLGDIGEGPYVEGSIAAEFAARRGIRFASVADLVVFTRTIAAKSTVETEEQFDENTGDASLQYKKRGDVKTPDGKPVVPPVAFVIRLPVFCGAEATEYNIAARLRYGITGSGIAWRVELHALDKYILAAIEEALIIVRRPQSDDAPPPISDPSIVALPMLTGGCGLPVFMGTAPPA